jgi:archaellum component FlaC
VRFDGQIAMWLLKLCGVESICLEKLNTQEMDTRVKNPKCDSNIQQIENFGTNISHPFSWDLLSIDGRHKQ